MCLLSLEYMILLFTKVGQVSLWISDKVSFKSISLEGINVNLMYGSVRQIVF